MPLEPPAPVGLHFVRGSVILEFFFRGDYGCLFYTRPLHCNDLLSEPVGGEGMSSRFGGRFKRLRHIVTEPVFIGVVSGTLFLSLALLAWTVVQCSKSKGAGQPGGTPLISAAQSNGSSNGLSIKKAPPRQVLFCVSGIVCNKSKFQNRSPTKSVFKSRSRM